MDKRIFPQPIQKIERPDPVARESFTDAAAATRALQALYARNTAFLRDSFNALAGAVTRSTTYRGTTTSLAPFVR